MGSYTLPFHIPVDGLDKLSSLKTTIESLARVHGATNTQIKEFVSNIREEVREGVRLESALKNAAAATGGYQQSVRQVSRALVEQIANTRLLERETEKLSSQQARAALSAVRSATGLQIPGGGQVTNMLGSQVGFGALAGVGAAAGIGYALASWAKETANTAREMSNLAERTGLTVREAQLFSKAAEVAGVNSNAFATSMRTLSRGLAEGGEEGKKQREALNQLGVSYEDNLHRLLPMGQVIQSIFDKLSKLNAGPERDLFTNVLFGRGGLELVPIMGRLKDLSAEIEKTGVVMNDQGISTARRYAEQLTLLGDKWQALKQSFAQPIIASVLFMTGGDFKPGPKLTQDEIQRGVQVDEHGTKFHIDRATGMEFIDSLPGGKSAFQAISDDASVRKGNSLYQQFQNRRGSSKRDLEGDLSEAKRKLSESPMPMAGLSTDEQEKRIAQYAAAENRVKALQDEIEATRKAEGQVRKLSEVLLHFADVDVSPLKRLTNTYKQDLTEVRPRDRDQVTTAYGAAYQREVTKHNEENAKKQAKQDLAEFGYNQKIGETTVTHFLHDLKKPEPDDVRSILEKGLSQGLPGPPGPSYRQQLESLQRQGSFQSRAIQLTSNPGYQGQNQAAMAEYNVRKQIADLEHTVEIEKANEQKDEMERTAALYDAKFNYEEKLKQIREDNELRILALQKQEKDQFQSLAVGFVNAAQTNSLPNFFKQQGHQLEDKVIGNLAGMAFPAIAKSIPNLTGGNPFMSKLLAGTPFAGNAFNDNPVSSTNANTKATDLNTVAVASLYQAVTGSSLSVPGISMPGIGGAGGLSGLSKFGSDTNGITGSGPLGALGGIAKLFGGGGGASSALSSSDFSAIQGDLSQLAGHGGPSASEVASGTMSQSSWKSNSIAGPLFDSSASAGSRLGSGIASAGVIYGGVTSAIHDFKQGGARGTISGIGDIAGTIAAFDPEPISKAILSGVALGSKIVSSLFGDPRQNRQNQINKRLNADQFYAPVAVNATMSTSGSAVGYDRFGNIQSLDASPYPQVQEPYADLRNGVNVPGRTFNPIGGPSGINPGPTIVYAPQVTAFDGQDVHRVLTQHAGVLADVMGAAVLGGKGENLMNALSQRG